MAERKRDKPQGASGPLMLGAGSIDWAVIEFPGAKDERELRIGELFVRAAANRIRCESSPTMCPFADVRQNAEDDLDLTISTNDGDRLMELAEFAPLNTFGPTFAKVPTAIASLPKVDEAERLVRNKSRHQGAPGRLLLLYTTEQAFELTGSVVELLRRRFEADPPSFDRVYYLCPVTIDIGVAYELFPGTPDPWFGPLSDGELEGLTVIQPHPRDMKQVRSFSWDASPLASGGPTIRYTVTFEHDFAAPSQRGRERDG